MVKISCHVYDKKGNQVFEGFENGYAVFEGLGDFYKYMHMMYGFTRYNYDFVISGCEI